MKDAEHMESLARWALGICEGMGFDDEQAPVSGADLTEAMHTWYLSAKGTIEALDTKRQSLERLKRAKATINAVEEARSRTVRDVRPSGASSINEEGD